MLFTSFSQVIALVVLFFGGLILGLGLHPGGKKWRQRFTDEREHYAQFRRDAEKRLRICNKRIVELERINAEMHEAVRSVAGAPQPARTEPDPPSALPAGPGRIAAVAAAVPAFFYPPAPAAEPVAPPTAVEPPQKAWFGSGSAPDLSRIRGIDAALKTRLFGLGVTRFEDITEMSAVDEMALEQRLELPAGYITSEQWREQAALLRAGQDAEQAERFPPR